MLSTVFFRHFGMALTPAEKQRRYRERRKVILKQKQNLDEKIEIPYKQTLSARFKNRRQGRKNGVMHTPELSPSHFNTPAPSNQYQLIPNAGHRFLRHSHLIPVKQLPALSYQQLLAAERNCIEIDPSYSNTTYKLKEELEAIQKRCKKYNKMYNREKRKRSKIEGGSQ